MTAPLVLGPNVCCKNKLDEKLHFHILGINNIVIYKLMPLVCYYIRCGIVCYAATSKL